MNVRGIFLVICSCFFCYVSYGNILQGYVRDTSGAPLPYCNVYLENTPYSCATNEDGFFLLQAPPGKYVAIFQFIGFMRSELPVDLNEKEQTVTIVLRRSVLELEEVVVDADQESLADRVMRTAIDKRKEHLQEIYSFHCSVYIKGLQKLTSAPNAILGIDLKTVLELDSNNTGIFYLSESVSDYAYSYPDKTKEIMTASRVSGGDKAQFSYNDPGAMQMQFYENNVPLEGISQRGFISPLADNAFFYYDYAYSGSLFEAGHEIYKIRVAPKRNTDPAFSGTVYITDDDYRLTGLQLEVYRRNGMDFVDTFHVDQEFFQPEKGKYALLSNKFSFSYSVFGISGNGYFNAFYSDYTINPIFPKGYFTAEVSKIETDANAKDSAYWKDIRPVILTREESRDYDKKDSLRILHESPAYLDSIDKVFNRFKPGSLLAGYNYRNSQKKWVFSTNPAFDLLRYNTVEGWTAHLAPHLYKGYENKKNFNVSPVLEYGFGNKTWYGSASADYTYDPKHSGKLYFAAGHMLRSYNKSGISPLLNLHIPCCWKRTFSNFIVQIMYKPTGYQNGGTDYM
ncbi:MAG: DUF5686 and carboxypeptidase regulatory-like domain-containing protein [Chitinophagales bacterium]